MSEDDIGNEEAGDAEPKNNTSDSLGLKEVVDAANSLNGQTIITNQNVASQAYNENFRPAAAELGKTATTLSKSVNLALFPLEGLVWGFDKIKASLSELLSERLVQVPVKKIEPPLINIAGPAIEAMRFSGGQPDLQKMFANLIATSMIKDTKSSAHPAFVEVIKQLTSQEATFLNFLKYLLLDSLAKWRTIELHEEIFQKRNPNHKISLNHSDYGESQVEARKTAEQEIMAAELSLLINDPRLHNFIITSIDKRCLNEESNCSQSLERLRHEHQPSFLSAPVYFIKPPDNLWEFFKEENINNLKRLELLEFSSSVQTRLEEGYSRRELTVNTRSIVYLRLTEFGRSFLSACLS